MTDDSEKLKSLFSIREKLLTEKWAGVNDTTPVNTSQYSFDDSDRQKTFDEGLVDPDQQAAFQQYREEWYRRAKEFDAGPMPLSVGIELVSTCNLNCPMCYTITEEFQNSVIGGQRMLPWPIVKAILDEAAELKVPSILFSWRGESSLYRSVHEGKTYNIADAFAYARKKGIMETSVLTNGQTLTPELSAQLIAADASWINISIDGVDEVYNLVRTPKNKRGKADYDAFAVICENIRTFVRLRNEAGKRRPKLRSNTIFPAIAKDPEGYKRKMIEIGIDWVTVNEILDFRGSGPTGEELPEEAIVKDWACQYPFQRLMISANGIIVPCTGAHNEEKGLVLGRYLGTPAKSTRAVDGSIAITDVKEVSLLEAWTGKKLENIRYMHKTGQRACIRPGCRNCRHGAVKHGVTWLPEDWNLSTMNWEGHIFRNG